ncbi:MAG: hypothetical protein LBL47_03895 [Lactobacillus sp.]|jgi:Ca2+/Na+ antiporter|nr:hypothetical protein [Lactobacillus sp.]
MSQTSLALISMLLVIVALIISQLSKRQKNKNRRLNFMIAASVVLATSFAVYHPSILGKILFWVNMLFLLILIIEKQKQKKDEGS